MRRMLILAGLVVSLAMASRAQLDLDQYVLAVRGWLLASEGWLVPIGALTAAGGFQPGSLTSLLMGAPLLIWEDYRAIGLLTIATHLVAYLVLDRALADLLGRRGRLLFAIVYWLNPWRLFYSAHIWNPNLIFLPAALHLATALRSRERPRAWQSFLHVVALGAAFQLHASFLILAIASSGLVLRRRMRVHWRGAAAGAAAVGLSLLPWLQAAIAHPRLLPLSGASGSNLLSVLPTLEGMAYWLRYPGLAVSSKMTRFDFSPAFGARWDAWLAQPLWALAQGVGVLSLFVALAANVWLWRRRRRASRLEWLLDYARALFFALVVVFALNPSDPQIGASGTTSWRGFVVLHAAALPVVVWLTLLWRTRLRRRVTRALALYTCALLVTLAAMAVGAPMYRKGGEDHLRCVVGSEHAMHERLGIAEGATIEIDPERGFDSELFDGPESLRRPTPAQRL